MCYLVIGSMISPNLLAEEDMVFEQRALLLGELRLAMRFELLEVGNSFVGLSLLLLADIPFEWAHRKEMQPGIADIAEPVVEFVDIENVTENVELMVQNREGFS